MVLEAGKSKIKGLVPGDGFIAESSLGRKIMREQE